MHVLCTMYTVADSVHLRMDSSTPQHTLQDACTTYYVHSGGFSPLENGLFNTTAYTTRCMYYVLCTQWRIQMHVLCTMYTVADSVHLRMDSSTPQHTLQDACTMYYVHSGGFSPLENGLFNTTAYTTRCMYYVLCTQWRIQST